MRIAFRVILLLAAAGAAGFYGWHIRLAFRVPEPATPIPDAAAEDAWQWGLAQMEEHGYTPVGEPEARSFRMGPAPRGTYWLLGDFPFSKPTWRRQSETVDLDPVRLGPGQCIGMLTRGGGDFEPPFVELWRRSRWWASSHRFGVVSVLQLCVPPRAETESLGAALTVHPMADGEFVNEGEVRWARFESRMREGDPMWLLGSPGPELKEVISRYVQRQPTARALADGMVARREAQVSANDVLLVPHSLATYQKLLARFESAYPGKVPNPTLVAPSSGEVPAASAEPEVIAAHVLEHTVFDDGSTVRGHGSFIDGRILAALDLDALGGCARVLVRRHAEHAIPSLEVRIDDDEPVELQVARRNVVVHELCPGSGFARLVTHPLEDASYTIAVYVPGPSDAAHAESDD